MIRKANDFRQEKRAIGGGVGELVLNHKLSQQESFEKCRVCAEIIIEPGQSIGMHVHDIEAEIYYMLAGELVSINEDGTEELFNVGDIMITGGGAKHSVRNDTNETAKLLAIVIN